MTSGGWLEGGGDGWRGEGGGWLEGGGGDGWLCFPSHLNQINCCENREEPIREMRSITSILGIIEIYRIYSTF